MYFLNGGGRGGGYLKSNIPVIDDFRFGKTVNEPKTLGTTALRGKPDFGTSKFLQRHFIQLLLDSSEVSLKRLKVFKTKVTSIGEIRSERVDDPSSVPIFCFLRKRQTTLFM